MNFGKYKDLCKKSYTLIRKKIESFDRLAMDFMYPPRCPICDKIVLPQEGICAKCREKLPWIESACMKCGKALSEDRKEFCYDCERKKHRFIQGKALWSYQKEVRLSLYRYKYQNKREYGTVYAKEIKDCYGRWICSKKIQGIIPVPLHKKRRKLRGYNQAEILAKELGRLMDIPVYEDLIVRVRNTKPQKMLSEAERKNNLKKAFKMRKNVVQLQYILIIDDIYTTGSTIDAIADILTDAGVAEIYACCVSIGKGS